jgi:hypothetical protein
MQMGKPVVMLCTFLVEICGFVSSLPGHFHIEECDFYLLAPLIVLPLISLFGKSKRSFCIVAVISFLIPYLFISSTQFGINISNEYSCIDAQKRTFTITGPIDTAEKLEKTISAYSTQKFNNTCIVISDYTPENLNNCINIIKFCQIHDVFIAKPVFFSYELEKLFAACERDGIIPQIIDIDKTSKKR